MIQSIESSESLRTIFDFLSQGDSIPKTKERVIAVSGNWYDTHGKDEAIRSLAFPDSRILIAGGIGRLSSKRARELGAEAYELTERLESIGISKDRIQTYVDGKFTTDNVDSILQTTKNIGYRELVVPEESYLSQRVRATFQGRKRHFDINNLNVTISPIHTLPEFLNLHKRDVALFLLCGEIDRLRDYSDSSSPGPYIFEKEDAFKGSEFFGGFPKIEKDAENLRTLYDYKNLKEKLNSNEGLKYFSPK